MNGRGVNDTVCGRFTLRTSLNTLSESFFFDLPAGISGQPRYNIAPTQPILALRQDDASDKRTAMTVRWGLVPSWAKDASIGSRMINARSETAHEKPSFRAAFKRRRCLIPADGYYEWQKREDGKQPWLFHRESDEPFTFAGLWESWHPAGDSEVVLSATILTTTPNQHSAAIHDRMPVILQGDAADCWLDPANEDVDQLRSLLVPCDDQYLEVAAVSTHVNNPRHEDPACVVPI